MSGEATERIHSATPHRRQLARQQGYAAKSHDLTFAAVFLAGVLLVVLGGKELLGALGQYAQQQLSGQTLALADAAAARDAWYGSIPLIGPSLAVVGGVLLGVAVVSHLLQTGFQPQPQRLAPDLSRFHPLATAARMFSAGAAAQQLLNVLKLAVLMSVAAWALWDQRERILTLGSSTGPALADSLTDVVGSICLRVGGALLIVGAADYGLQRWRYELSLRMTPEEIREEMRNQNGDPAVQRRRRQLQETLALRHLDSAVAQSQLVLQGPSQAVALQYDPRTMSAPIVVAKGSGDAAAKILQIAQRAGIRVAQDPRLARTIARQTPVGDAVATEHYRAIADLIR